MMFNHLLLLVLSLFMSTSLFALVDYSDDSSSDTPVSASKIKRNSETGSRSVKSSGQRASGGDSYRLTTKFESISVDTNNAAMEGKADVASVAVHIPTPVGIFFDSSYWQGSSTNPEIGPTSYQKGNPKFILGFNWLQLGGAADAVRADIYGGASFKTTNSTLGSSRNDQIYGMNTSKRFYDVVIMLGGEYVVTSKTYNAADLEIGNITKLSGAVGWVVSNDIRIAVEATRVTVKAKSLDNVDNKDASVVSAHEGLNSDLTFSTISPHLYLGIAPMIELELGASFRTQKAELDQSKDKQNLIDAKLFDYNGSYGNSIFAGLHLSV